MTDNETLAAQLRGYADLARASYDKAVLVNAAILCRAADALSATPAVADTISLVEPSNEPSPLEFAKIVDWLIDHTDTWDTARTRLIVERKILVLAATFARRLSATSGASAWRPIETAPKDGTDILGWLSAFEYEVIRWNIDHECWSQAGYKVPEKYPTHWQPLPPPPTTEPDP